jgi:hypothetical protein
VPRWTFAPGWKTLKSVVKMEWTEMISNRTEGLDD